MASIFSYSHLPENSIRVLRLDGTDEKNRLQCTLTGIPLDKTTGYDALSYAWNDELPTRRISCNGEPMLITASLDGALRMLQGKGWSRPLWADAICINQIDHEEKERQVPRIGLVYSNANTVIVWLGLSGRRTNVAMDAIDSLIKRLASVDGMIWRTSSKELRARGLPGLEDPLWKGIGDLIHRKYFRRLWTIQEFTLAKRCLIFCGEKSISSRQLLSLTESVRITGTFNAIDSQSVDEEYSREPYSFTMDAREYAQIALIIQRYRHDGDSIPLTSLLSVVRTMESSEPVDRVYAILALTEAEVLHDIGIDYSDESRRNYWRLFTYVGHLILRQMDNLDLFYHISASGKSSQLPSWCPNWNTRREVWHLNPQY